MVFKLRHELEILRKQMNKCDCFECIQLCVERSTGGQVTSSSLSQNKRCRIGLQGWTARAFARLSGKSCNRHLEGDSTWRCAWEPGLFYRYGGWRCVCVCVCVWKDDDLIGYTSSTTYFLYWSILNMEALCFSSKSENIYQSQRRIIPKDINKSGAQELWTCTLTTVCPFYHVPGDGICPEMSQRVLAVYAVKPPCWGN